MLRHRPYRGFEKALSDCLGGPDARAPGSRRGAPELVAVRTEAVGNAVVLRVEDGGPGLPPEKLPRMFEPLGESRAGTNRLELAACRTLVRRFQGKIFAENRATGGLVLVVELPGERP